jgi:archaeosine synthase beta-subunit
MSDISIAAGATAETNRSRLPIYDGTRLFLGHKDLVVSFYTMKCQFECSYCALPLRSANEPVKVADLNAQIELVFEKHRDALSQFQQFSFGNEGSALDRQRFYAESMHFLLERSKALSNLEVLSIETRPEYITPAAVEDVLARTHAKAVDVTVGFETQDDKIRINLLKKRISRRDMEARIALLGRLGVRLTSYVMVKPAPRMTEQDGVREAVATIVYLAEQCEKQNVDLIIYLTPTYIAEGSYLDRTCSRADYLPPTIQSVLRVIVEGRRLGVPIYTGVWHEGLAEEGNDFRGREGYDPALRKAIVRFNQTNDFSFLEPFIERS